MAKSSKQSEKNGDQKAKRLGDRVRAELVGITLLIIGGFLAASIATFHSGDPSFNNVVSGSYTPQNSMGLVGAYVADLLVQGFGVAAYFLPVAVFIFACRYMLLKPVRYPAWVAFGYSVLTILSSAMASLAFGPVSFDRDEFSAGGVVGDIISYSLAHVLNRPGAYLFIGAGLLCSLIFTVNFSLYTFGDRLRSWLVTFLQGLRERYILRREQRAKEKSRKKGGDKKKAEAVKKAPKIVADSEVERSAVQEEFEFVREVGGYHLPPNDIFDTGAGGKGGPDEESLLMASRQLVKKLQDFGVDCTVETVRPGPVITMFEIKPAPGVKINKIVNLSDDLAMALRAQSIRIVAPIPGKDTVGVEIPNLEREMVTLGELFDSKEYRNAPSPLKIALGKDISGNPVIGDLSKMPHLLIAGATGSGKSVAVHAILASLLQSASPKDVRLLIVDPKMLELSVYDDIPHLLLPVVTESKKAAVALRWGVAEMERRYRLMAEAGVRNISSYNKKVEKAQKGGEALVVGEENEHEHLPYIVVIIDELADLMMVAAKDVEDAIARLAQMARAAGIHLIVATQRPSVDVLTGMIKANFPARIAFQVASRVDSRTILDSIGAETLLGGGDMLFLPPGASKIMRVHGSFVSEQEIAKLTEFLRGQGEPMYNDDILKNAEEQPYFDEEEGFDELYDAAVHFVTEAGQASTSMVQRRFKIGYNRAARLIDMMEREEVIGPSRGAKPREVLAGKV
ncbi:MAG: cell division protein FtsK [Deltaproteobacteria bacterium]|nr:MAG: cell division protein FtsK [Deltaproteobacteria bacterium]